MHRSRCANESTRQGDGRVDEPEGERTTVKCQGNFRASHDDSVGSSLVESPGLGSQVVDGPEGDRGGRCLDAIARVVEGGADPALALLVGFEETIVAAQIGLCYVRLVHATGVGAGCGQKPDSAALRQGWGERGG